MKEIVLKIHDRLGLALEQQAAEYGVPVHTFLKMQLHAASVSDTGIRWRIDLPPLPPKDAPLFDRLGIDTTGALPAPVEILELIAPPSSR